MFLRRFSVLSRPSDMSSLRSLGTVHDYVHLHLPSSSSFSWASSLPHTALIHFRNASARNAFSGKMMAELHDAIDAIECSLPSLSCVVLRGADGHFCAGADIRVAKTHLSSQEGGAAMSRVMTHALSRLRGLPLVSVAVLEGAAVGGGAELTTSCDFRIMKTSAKVAFVHANMGVVPGWGGAARLVKLVGRQQALKLLGRTEKMDAKKALEIGFADVIADDIEAATIEFLKPFNEKEPHVMQGLKRAVANADDIVFDQMQAKEHEIFQELWGGPANIAALDRHRTK
ncbi:hypothetical protein THRCLA_05137 [Thraustotheca clavata]|uniref:Ethylmalonyl-CoA decarboxylase n=1 Tax=Thraustotheca clavata TaxID=74557 RepID=A0A1V9ZWV7_9STRA|nr:hypothetical protein THRCLA_05137 [Thraustotheca clavata]